MSPSTHPKNSGETAPRNLQQPHAEIIEPFQTIPTGKIVVLNGFPGTGKLTILKHLKRLLPADTTCLLDNHLLIDPVAAVIPDRSDRHHELRRLVRAPVFEELGNRAREGHIILMTACLAAEGESDTAFFQEHLNIARNGHISIYWINVHCDLAILRRRVTDPERQHGSKTKLTDVHVLQSIVEKHRLIEPLSTEDKYAKVAFEKLDKYTVGWICAVTTEFVAAQAFLDEEHDQLETIADKDDNNYALGRIGKHNVVIAALPKSEYGTTSAAVVANNMLRSFPNIRFGLMVGPGGGAPSAKHDIRLGDVVVMQGQNFVPTGFLNQPPQLLLTALSGLEARYEMRGHELGAHIDRALEQWPRLRKKYSRPPSDSDRLYRSDVVHQNSIDGCDDTCGNDPARLVTRTDRDEGEDDPAIHFGLITSADKLMKDALIRDNKVEAEMPIREILSSMMGMASRQHLAKIERWLSPSDYSTNANLARKQRHPDTGTWLLKSHYFQQWKLGSRQYLWLYGLAGCGKTILSTTILDHLLSLGTHTTMAFFFDFNDPKKQTLESLLCSLVFQLYHTGEEAGRRLDDLFASHDNGLRQPDTTTLSDYIVSAIQATGDYVVVIDALDECTTRRELVHWIECLASKEIQFIVTGRPEADFKSTLPRLFDKRNCILLDKAAVDADIRSYVRETLEQKPDFVEKKLSWSLLNEVFDKVGNEADGMFRWAACQLENLARCLSPKDIKTTLRSLPRDLDGTYCRILQSIPLEYKCAAIRLLQFLIYTKRPLKVSEAIKVIATQIEQEPQGFDINGRPSQQHDVLRYCPGLITILQVRTSAGGVNEVLRFTHFSVKEYLLKQDRFDLESASIAITKTCLTYLHDIKCQLKEIEFLFPLSQYAAQYWTEYAVPAETSEDVIQSIVAFLGNETTLNRWIQLNQTDHPLDCIPLPAEESIMQGDQYTHTLRAAASQGLLEVVQLLLHLGVDVNKQVDKFGNALQAAAYRGHLEVVQLLLDKGANCDMLGGRFGTALKAAFAQRNMEVMQLLIDHGANVNRQGRKFRSPLYAASEQRNLEAVRLLLVHGADINEEGGLYGGALHVAAQRHASPELMKLLLDHGADVNKQMGFIRNPLQAAVFMRSNWEVIRLLLDHGADVSKHHKILGNALHGASLRGDVEAMRLLLDYGADVNLQGGVYGNALQAATAKTCNLEAMKLLLDEGADINAQGGEHGSALQAAALRPDNLDTIQFLLDKGADVDAGAKYCDKTFQFLSRRGHLNVE
ncbi:hypothetical protein FSARC_8924 [Fusarium sarcochroum]|uniref:Nephrocystin 3-like N-terminal domain-containing protein n=1 Tax=Fusarium sarcochroum TaxID=1208366 RepID=A0A8H4TSE9_9HYPO|nr:hypothetical protein FSARC_8924 [Fusarium sarcochroum]